MALITYSNLEEVTYSTGIGDMVLSGPGRGGQGLYSRCSNGDTFRYYISGVDSSGKPDGEWEQGLGTWRTGNIVERTSIDSSSNSDAKVSFSAGPKYLKVLSSVNEGLSPTQVTAVSGLVSGGGVVIAASQGWPRFAVMGDSIGSQHAAVTSSTNYLNAKGVVTRLLQRMGWPAKFTTADSYSADGANSAEMLTTGGGTFEVLQFQVRKIPAV